MGYRRDARDCGAREHLRRHAPPRVLHRIRRTAQELENFRMYNNGGEDSQSIGDNVIFLIMVKMVSNYQSKMQVMNVESYQR